MNSEKIRKYADIILITVGLSFMAYVFFSRVLIYVLPFLIGWFIAFAMRPPASYLSRKIRIKEKYLRMILTVLLCLFLFGACAVGIWLLSREIWELLAGLGDGGTLGEFISAFMGTGGFFGRMFGDFSDYVADLFSKIAMSMLSSLGSFVSGIASAVPKALFFLLITVISSVYFALGLEEINACVRRLLPRKVYESVVKFKDGFLGAILKYLRSYLFLLLITFAEMLIGLFLIRAPYPLIMAIVIALLDLLPVIGVGFVLIPWGAWSFIVGNTSFGIGLTVLFVLHTVLRQVLEPRIVGKNLGMHPLLTLIFIYVGYSLFGIIGILLVPIFTVLVNVAFNKKDSAKISDDTKVQGDDG